MNFEQMARELREQHQNACTGQMLKQRYLGGDFAAMQKEMDDQFDERCIALLRRVADAENEACEEETRKHAIPSHNYEHRYCCDVADAIAARRKDRK